MSNSPCKLFLIDDHQLVIDGIKSLLQEVDDIVVIGEANAGEEALRALQYLQPDMVLLDVNMPGMDGVTTCQAITAKYPRLPVLTLTMHQDRAVINAMTRAGAVGVVLKNTSREELVEAIRKVQEGRRYFSPEVTETLLQPAASPHDQHGDVLPAVLTSREREILCLIAEGYSNTEIGDRLSISHRTVDTHRTNLMKKLQVRNIAGLIRYAFRHGLVT